MKNEPVITVMSISALVSAALGLLVVFGIEISNEQVEAILGFVAVAVPLILGMLAARARVTPVGKPRPKRRKPRNPSLRA